MGLDVETLFIERIALLTYYLDATSPSMPHKVCRHQGRVALEVNGCLSGGLLRCAAAGRLLLKHSPCAQAVLLPLPQILLLVRHRRPQGCMAPPEAACPSLRGQGTWELRSCRGSVAGPLKAGGVAAHPAEVVRPQ